MSATAETDTLRAFFEEGYARKGGFGAHDDNEAHANGTSEPDDHEGPDPEWSGISSDDERDVAATNGDGAARELQSRITYPITTCYIEGRQYQVTLKHTAEPVQDIVETSLRMIFQIHRQEPMPGDVLVFFHGRDIITSLESLDNQ